MRNIVLITWDSVRADHCSFMGYHRETTPFLDKMAKKGLVFEKAISPSNSTLPSMKAIFTGRHLGWHEPTINGVFKQALKELSSQTTLAEMLRKIGYYTIGFSPNAWTSRYFGFNKGFNDFVDSFSKKSKFKLYEKIFSKIDNKYIRTFRCLINFIFKNEVFSTWEKYYYKIINYVEKSHSTGQPVFLWVFLTDTHLPYYSPKAYRKWSNAIDMDVFNIYYTYKLFKNDFTISPSERMLKVLINAYDDSIRYADAFVRTLWVDLKKLDPIFIVHADHGEGFYEHGFIGHNHPTLYEENIHVPFLIFNTDIGDNIKEPISLIDLSKIILKLLKNDYDFTHLSRKPIISRVLDRDGLFRVAVEVGDWKLITQQGNATSELYNLKDDPKETRNLINKYPDTAEKLKIISENNIKQETEKEKIRAIANTLKRRGKSL